MNTMQMKIMTTLSKNYRAIVSGDTAFLCCAGGVIVLATDGAVSIFFVWGLPVPGGKGVVGDDFVFHFDICLFIYLGSFLF